MTIILILIYTYYHILNYFLFKFQIFKSNFINLKNKNTMNFQNLNVIYN